MEFYSPQPEHAQLNTGLNQYNPKTSASQLLGLLHQQVQQATRDNQSRNRSDSEETTGIDSVLEENAAILSPPLSPQVDSVAEENEYVLDSLKLDDVETDEADSRREAIKVNPAWRPGLSPRIYRHSTHEFLSEYRIFQNLTNGADKLSLATGPTQLRSIRRARVYKPVGVESERIGRTRRTARVFSEDENTEVEFEFKRPATPRRVKKSSNPHHSHQLTSPLASARAVNGMPQYVPNMSWEKLPDYSPPVDTLPSNNVKCLKVEWKGSPMDLSSDPLKDKLHPAELVLAQILRLPCDLYLDSKRRLFLEKTHRLQQGLPFRRTDAQKACRIDVNKASRLYAAFEKVGWLSDSNFTKFI